nr:Ig-like domain-containing protein [Curtobacterium pusillum]
MFAAGSGLLAVTAAITLSGTVGANAAVGPDCADGTCTITFSVTGAPETWTVPAGVTAITATVEGASGGSEVRSAASFYPSIRYPAVGAGGTGGAVRGTVPVTAGSTLSVVVGAAGADGLADAAGGAAGGYGGGGDAGHLTGTAVHNAAGAGGGGSFLFGDDELLIAAGGGGGGTSIEGGEALAGGAGGSTGAGADGTVNTTSRPNYSATGATTTGPGTSPASISGSVVSPASSTATTSPSDLASAGDGAVNTSAGAGGYGTAAGGGGGYFGGGGGATDGPGGWVGAGGGGSGFQAPSVTDVAALAANTGDGSVVISYADPTVATATTLRVSETPTADRPVTLTATVTPSAAIGNVTFLDGDSDLGTATLDGGVATLSVTLTEGQHALTAHYDGAGQFTSSTSDVTTVSVAAAPAAPPVTPTPTPSPTTAPTPSAAPTTAPTAAPTAVAVAPTASPSTAPSASDEDPGALALAFTGTDPFPALGAAGALLLAGLGLFVARSAARRRSTGR